MQLSFELSVFSVLDAVLSSGLIAGICAGVGVGVVLLLAAAVLAVIYYRCRSSKKGKYHLQILL